MTNKDNLEQEAYSEFGKGFIYNFFLFAKHYERMRKYKDEISSYTDVVELWFNGAADHLFELEIPKKLESTEIAVLAEDLKQRGIDFRLSMDGYQPSEEDFKMFFEDCEKLMRLIDEWLGVETIEANWN